MTTTNTRVVSNLRADGGLFACAAFLLDGMLHRARYEGDRRRVVVRDCYTGAVVDFEPTPEILTALAEAWASAVSLNAELAESPDVVRALPIVVLPGVTDAG